MHCFSGDTALAEEMISLGFMLSISGVVTFKNATMLHEVVQAIDLTYLMLETDAPFLAPVTYRGKRNNRPIWCTLQKKSRSLKDFLWKKSPEKQQPIPVACFTSTIVPNHDFYLRKARTGFALD